jgi:hypothetical protein
VAQFSYVSSADLSASLMPRLALMLALRDQKLDVEGLLDTGAAVNVSPYAMGIALGAAWEAQTTIVPLVGNLGQFEARALVLKAMHPRITPGRAVQLIFAWTRAENAPLIFRQMNFFLEFDVCFYRAQGVFEVQVSAKED